MAKEPEAQAQLTMPDMPVRFTAKRMLVAVVVIAVHWWAFYGTGLNPVTIVEGMPAMWDLMHHMFPPSLKNYQELVRPALETVYIGVLATIIGSVLSIPVGFLAAANMSPMAAVEATIPLDPMPASVSPR
jgi:phosphonate transport system permease protein